MHVPSELVKPLLVRVDVEVRARIGATHDHHDEVVADGHGLVVHRWLEQVLVVADPLREVDRGRDGGHDGSFSGSWATPCISIKQVWVRKLVDGHGCPGRAGFIEVLGVDGVVTAEIVH